MIRLIGSRKANFQDGETQECSYVSERQMLERRASPKGSARGASPTMQLGSSLKKFIKER